MVGAIAQWCDSPTLCVTRTLALHAVSIDHLPYVCRSVIVSRTSPLDCCTRHFMGFFMYVDLCPFRVCLQLDCICRYIAVFCTRRYGLVFVVFSNSGWFIDPIYPVGNNGVDTMDLSELLTFRPRTLALRREKRYESTGRQT